MIQNFNVFNGNTNRFRDFKQRPGDIHDYSVSFLKNKLVTSNGSFKNANHSDSGTVDQEAIYSVVSPVSETLLRVKIRRLRYRCRSNISIQVPVWCLLPGGNRLRCGLNGVGGDS